MTTEIIMFSDPKPRNEYHHTDVDGDRLSLNRARLPDGRRGVNIRTDEQGSTLLPEDIKAFITVLQEIMQDIQAPGGTA